MTGRRGSSVTQCCATKKKACILHHPSDCPNWKSSYTLWDTRPHCPFPPQSQNQYCTPITSLTNSLSISLCVFLPASLLSASLTVLVVSMRSFCVESVCAGACFVGHVTKENTLKLNFSQDLYD